MRFGDARRKHVLDRLDRDALFIAGLSITWLALLARIPLRLNQDAWLTLVAGREVADRGIPRHDRLTVLSHGVRWIDQQWLSQWAMYDLYRIGGLALLCIAYTGLVVGAIALAIVAARRLGAADLHVLAIMVIPAALFMAASGEVRTQGFAYPLFVALLWLLTVESRTPTRRGYLAFALLLLWANLHGSVTIGVTLGVIHGLSLVLRRSTPRTGSRDWPRALAFIVGSPLCLLATPYGLGGIDYYRGTLLNTTFRKVIQEWAPVTSITVLAVPFFVVAFGAVWLLGRSQVRHTLFEHLTLYALIAGGVTAVRNVTWLGLAAIVLLPALVGEVRGVAPPKARRPSLNIGLAVGSLALLCAAVLAVALQPASWFEKGYDAGAATAVADAVRADPSLLIYGGDRFGDWLLWHEPQLAGRIAYDARLELLTQKQLRRLSELVSEKRHSEEFIARFGLLVLDPGLQPSFTRSYVSAPNSTVVFRGHDVIVVKRPAR